MGGSTVSADSRRSLEDIVVRKTSLFANWYSRRDPTHVVFDRATIPGHIAKHRDWTREVPAKDVALMQKRTMIRIAV
jgi:hypothetical protein